MDINTSFSLHPIAPFRLDYTVLALRRRSKNIIDCWDGKYYTRVFNIDNELIKVTIEQINSHNSPELLVLLNQPITPILHDKISHLIEMMFSLKRDLCPFYNIAKNDARLNSLVLKFMGVKPPRFPSLFETLINAISCQQISLDVGLQIQNRLIQHVGKRIQSKNGIFYAFPIPDDVCHCSVDELKKIGYSTQKSETIIRVSATLKEKQYDFDRLENMPNEELVHFLCQFKGVGRWTAEYVLLRGLGRMEVFPGDDIGAQNNLQKWLHLDEKLDYKKTLKITAQWHPYEGFIYFHLLLQKLSAALG